MMYEWSEVEWWAEDSVSNCSRDQIEEMLENTLVLSLYQSATDREEGSTLNVGFESFILNLEVMCSELHLVEQ